MTGDFLLYDGQCPACNSFIAFSRLRETNPSLQVLDAREHPALVRDLRRDGYEINEGMIMRRDGRISMGAEVTEIIARSGEKHGVRHGVLWTIGEAPWSRALYPVLREGRGLLLRLLGRSPVG